jgi:TatD DNase family protein
LIDIGVNLTNSRFDRDRSSVIARAVSHGITGMLVTGTSVEVSRQAIALCQAHPDYLRCTVGIHPHDADRVDDDYLQQLADLAGNAWVKAIGECGLDFNRNFSAPAQQLRIFAEQVQLAQQLQLPLFLHQRDAFAAWINVLTSAEGNLPTMVTHCFTGDLIELRQCLNLGMYIGITGWLCDQRRGQTLRDIVQYIPLDRLMIETDAPYLLPRTIKPKPKSSRNEPYHLAHIVQSIAHHSNYSVDDIVEQTQANSKKVFNWGTS